MNIPSRSSSNKLSNAIKHGPKSQVLNTFILSQSWHLLYGKPHKKPTEGSARSILYDPDFVRWSKRKDLWHFFLSLHLMAQMPELPSGYKFEPSEITAHLKAFPGDMKYYLPLGWTFENDQLDQLGFRHPVHERVLYDRFCPNWAVKSAFTQVSYCIASGLGQVVAISGQEAAFVAQNLKYEPYVGDKFDVVVFISLFKYRHNKKAAHVGIEKKIHESFGENMSYEAKGAPSSPNFLLILDDFDGSNFNPYKLKIPLVRGFIVLITESKDIYRRIAVDMEIKMEYHLLPWELFCKNVSISPRTEVAECLVEVCHWSPLATVLLARALKDVKTEVWNQALHALKMRHYSPTEDDATGVLVCVLKFIWKRMSPTMQICIRHFIEYEEGKKINADFMVSCWLSGCLVNTAEEGGKIVEELIDSFLIERSQQGDIHMQDKIKQIMSRILPRYYGLERMSTMMIEWDSGLTDLQSSEVMELSESPEYYHSRNMVLNGSGFLKIACSFFKHMPDLQVLDLSYTSIKTLPSSIWELVSLEKLILNGCELLMELLPEIGKLQRLEVLDLDGSEIMYIPREIENLKSLKILNLSIYGHGERFRRAKEIRSIYPEGAFSKLLNLKELSIDVNPDEKQWIDEVECIISDMEKIKLNSLKLYLPEVEQLRFLTPKNFKLIIGKYEQRLISRIPQEVEEKFKTLNKSLRYINGETISTHLVNALEHSHAFLLDRHWTIKKLSELGRRNLNDLEFVFLVECNELETILEEKHAGMLMSLKYLGLYYLRNLTSICRGQVGVLTLWRLKQLSLRTCTKLTQVFTFELLKNLKYLEELVLEDCPKITSLVTPQVSPRSTDELLDPFLLRLKKMSLIGLPELVSISNGICIAPKLERLVVFYCPKLESISPKELTCKHLKVLKGESEWWDTLEWDEWDFNDQDDLADIFVPINRDGNLNAQFTEDDF